MEGGGSLLFPNHKKIRYHKPRVFIQHVISWESATPLQAIVLYTGLPVSSLPQAIVLTVSNLQSKLSHEICHRRVSIYQGEAGGCILTCGEWGASKVPQSNQGEGGMLAWGERDMSKIPRSNQGEGSMLPKGNGVWVGYLDPIRERGGGAGWYERWGGGVRVKDIDPMMVQYCDAGWTLNHHCLNVKLNANFVVLIFTHLKLCLATAIHNFKWVKIIDIWQMKVSDFKILLIAVPSDPFC